YLAALGRERRGVFEAGRVLEGDRDADCAKLVLAILRFIFARAEDMGEGDAGVANGERKTDLRIADDRLLVDAVAVAEGVAVEENIARDRPGIEPCERVKSDIIRGDEKARSRQPRLDPRRAIVIRQVPARAHRRARIGVSVDVAERAADMRRDINGEAVELFGRERAPAPLIGEHEAGLVFQLVIPALRLRGIDDLVNKSLRLLAKR